SHQVAGLAGGSLVLSLSAPFSLAASPSGACSLAFSPPAFFLALSSSAILRALSMSGLRMNDCAALAPEASRQTRIVRTIRPAYGLPRERKRADRAQTLAFRAEASLMKEPIIKEFPIESLMILSMDGPPVSPGGKERGLIQSSMTQLFES